jgi:hypothetical protein
MKVTARSPATANAASKPGVSLVVVVDLVALAASVAGVDLVVVVVDLAASGLVVALVVVAVDLVASGLGEDVVAVAVDSVASSVTGSSSHCTIPLIPSSGFVLLAAWPMLGLR